MWNWTQNWTIVLSHVQFGAHIWCLEMYLNRTNVLIARTLDSWVLIRSKVTSTNAYVNKIFSKNCQYSYLSNSHLILLIATILTKTIEMRRLFSKDFCMNAFREIFCAICRASCKVEIVDVYVPPTFASRLNKLKSKTNFLYFRIVFFFRDKVQIYLNNTEILSMTDCLPLTILWRNLLSVEIWSLKW